MAYEFWPVDYWQTVFAVRDNIHSIYWLHRYWPSVESISIPTPIHILAKTLAQAQFVCLLSNGVFLHADIKAAPTIKENNLSSAAFTGKVIASAVYSSKLETTVKPGFGSTVIASSSFKAVFLSNSIFKGLVIAGLSFKSSFKSGASFNASILSSSDIRRD